MLSHRPADERRPAPAMDATTLFDRFVVPAISLVYRGCAIPIAWVVLPATEPGAWKPHWPALFQHLQEVIPADWPIGGCMPAGSTRRLSGWAGIPACASTTDLAAVLFLAQSEPLRYH